MSIKFNDIKEKPESTNRKTADIPEGKVILKIKGLKYIEGVDGKKEYINVMYNVIGPLNEGQNPPTMFDNLPEPTTPYTKYKLFRFMTAVGLEQDLDSLEDLTKLVQKDTEIVAYLTKNEKYNKVEPDIFHETIFEPLIEERTTDETTEYATSDEIEDPVPDFPDEPATPKEEASRDY